MTDYDSMSLFELARFVLNQEWPTEETLLAFDAALEEDGRPSVSNEEDTLVEQWDLAVDAADGIVREPQ